MNWVRDECGSALVEFAVGLSTLLSVVFGVMAICFALYAHNITSEVAREGARYAIVRGSACNSFTDCKITGPQIQTHLKNVGFPGINPANLTAATAWSFYPGTGTCQPSALCNNPGNLVTVTVTYQFPLVVPFVSSKTLTMSSTAAMVISQ